MPDHDRNQEQHTLPARDQAAQLTWLALAYAALIAYGSLLPLVDWRSPDAAGLNFLLPPYETWLIPTDILLNLMVYMPLGLLLGLRLRPLLGFRGALLVAILLGGLLSLAMETLQMFLPGRVSSVTDLAANGAGTLLGAMLMAFPGRRAAAWRRYWLLDPGGEPAMLAIALWGLAQLSPLGPPLAAGHLHHGLAPLIEVLDGTLPFAPTTALTHTLYLCALGLLALRAIRPERPALRLFLAFAALVLLLKVPMLGRQLSLEVLAGLACAALLLPPLARMSPPRATLLGIGLLAGGYLAASLAPTPTAGTLTQAFNWVPFKGHLLNLQGLANILASLWPFVAAGSLLRMTLPPASQHRAVALAGGLLVLLLSFGAEWLQQSLPGRYPDFTDVLLALAGWFLPWWLWPQASCTRCWSAAPRRGKSWPGLLVTLGTGALLAGLAAWSLSLPPGDSTAQVPSRHRFPEPAALRPHRLPGFADIHPRLPAPGPEDFARLRAENPAYLAGQAQRAAGREGLLEAVILLARADPGSQDLERLHRRLLELEFSGRGHEQAKPLALAYDWLHDQWNEEQLATLRDRLAEAGEYLIAQVRESQLSPYNVYLYNSPLQALMAVAIALYQDHPRADPIMAFTQDLWQQRVLPVWRQVMGRQGGWHEGGEYVGIGIGQAVYQVPALWRAATGEDLFATEPGLRGFLDFLVYRTRPDGSHFRWGDGRVFRRAVPDRVPLALEYRHAAAYSLEPPPAFAPTAWPWGPLPDPTLYDPAAVSRLPLSRFFDGLGLLVARSDWGADATYVTFKTGPNYWSHVHLDQGAFTLYKGGPLAIDSGQYGPDYGSDHHMNYSYQAIAHNTITVTDPADTVPAPARRAATTPRPIANDGGQRRVGSGWGEQPAPIDRMEWEAKRHLYETGQVLELLEDDGLAVALADVTPAYTNHLSGTGTFSDRTRRVERFWRTFAYDRIDDVVLVFDQVSASRPEFRKRWLLHSLDQPQLRKDGFHITVPATEGSGRAGGRLEGHVLLPRGARLHAVGGSGFEFYVDGRNYDVKETLAEVARDRKPQAEPGAWRIELMPPKDARDDLFLVIMLPTSGEVPQHRVRLLEDGRRVIVEVAGPRRTTRWWFNPERLTMEVEIRDVEGTRRHRLEARPPPPPNNLPARRPSGRRE